MISQFDRLNLSATTLDSAVAGRSVYNEFAECLCPYDEELGRNATKISEIGYGGGGRVYQASQKVVLRLMV
jgi:hypothetical protein